MDRLVETALGQAGDFAGASRWREAAEALGNGLRIAVVGTEAHAVHRTAQQLPPEVAVVCVLGDAASEEGIDATLLGVHALLWATPATTPLRASERHALTTLRDTAPANAAIALSDAALLSQLSDDANEVDAVRRRVARLAPAGWTVLTDVQTWLQTVRERMPELAAERKRTVAQHLLRDARAQTALAMADLDQQQQALVRRAERLRTEHETVLTQARQTASHVLGSMHRHTDALIAEHSSFVYQLESALPREIDAVDDRPVPPAGVAAWLAHVCDTWCTDAVARWQTAVRDDLARIAEDEWLDAAPLIVPPSSAPALGPTSSWTHRLVVSGALAGGAALAIAGSWAPGLSIAAGGATLAALHRLRTRPTADGLVDAARAALREMARDTQDLLAAHRASLSRALDDVVQSRAQDVASQLQDVERSLAEAGRSTDARRQEMRRARAVLDARLAAMDDAS